MDLSAIRGIVFDKDGTLFDFGTTWENWAAAFLARLSGGDAALAVAMGRAIGFSVPERSFAPDSIVIAGTPDEIAERLAAFCPDMSADTLIDLLNEEAARAPQQPAVPLGPLLTGLREGGLVLGVATNDAEAPARAHLGAADVDRFFDFIAGSDSGFGGKPAPGQLLAFAKAVDLSPEEVLMVGDSTHDLIAARAAGMTGLGVLTGYAGADELAPFACAVLPDIGHIPDWLRKGGHTGRPA